VAKPYNAKIALDIKDSAPDWAPFLSPRVPEGSPKDLVIVWDDGFGAMDGVEGPAETPTMGRIADQGVRFWNFHATTLCSLLTRRTATSNGTATVAEFAHQGSSNVFDRAMADFASAYADENQRNCEVQRSALKGGTLPSEPGIWSRYSGSASGAAVQGIELGTALHGP
jgi:hypothetical protein